MANDMRDRLVELIYEARKEWDVYFNDCLLKGKPRSKTLNEFIADHLIENGVIVLPCKVGTELFLSDYINGHHRLKEYKFLGNEIAVVIDCWEWQRTCTRMLSDFGKTVFLTKEEAEQKLKEMRGE